MRTKTLIGGITIGFITAFTPFFFVLFYQPLALYLQTILIFSGLVIIALTPFVVYRGSNIKEG